MSVSSSPAVVFWDFDGTLAFRDGLWRGALIDALDLTHPGHRVTREMVRAGLRAGFPWHRADVHHLDLDTGEAWWEALMPLLVGAYEQAGIEHALARRAARVGAVVYTDPRFWAVFDDTRRALHELHAAGFRNIVLSNHVPELPDLVRGLGLDGLIDDVLTSAATGYEKPNPQMFHLALQRAGDPEVAWMVGDNPEADVAGAEAVGIRGLLVRTSDGAEPGHDLEWAVRSIIEA